MTTYTYAQLEGLWINNGGSRATAPIAAAIAMAESSGESAVTSSNPDGGTNVGPWQLDTRGVGAGYSVAQLQNPNTNAAIAVKGSANGTDWSDWATYASGAYRAFMNNGTTPDANVPGGGAAGAATTAATASNQGGSSACLVGFPGFAGIGSFCVVSKSQARGVIGATLMATGGLVGVVGLLILAAASFHGSGAGHAAGGALEAVGAGLAFVPGAEGAGLAVGAAGAAARRAGSQGAPRASLDRRITQRGERDEAREKEKEKTT